MSPKIFEAVKNNDWDGIARLIENGIDINIRDKEGMTALIYASWNGKTEIVKKLLHNGADVNSADNLGWTALMLASAGGYASIIEMLILSGADIHAKSHENATALMYAANSDQDHPGCIKLLTNHGALINEVESINYSALTFAAMRGNLQAAVVLIESGADININYGKHSNPLATAKEYKRVEMVDLLRKHNARE